MVKLDVVTPHSVVDTTSVVAQRAANVGGIALENFIIAIDSGRAETGNLLRPHLEAFFHLPVRHLHLTHMHTDHRNGIAAFKDVTLIASQQAFANLPKSVKLTGYNLEAFEEKLVINDGDFSVEFHHVGGHTVGSSVAYFPAEKVLFGGDLFMAFGPNFKLPILTFYQNTGRKTGNPDEYITAFEKLKAMDIEIIVPGHGSVIFTPQEELDLLLTFFKSLRALFIAAIDEKQALKTLELPHLDVIERDFRRIEELPTKLQTRAKRQLNSQLNLLKTSFYNYYKTKTAH
ncbi:MAG: MBL fold metallo-hydrolase [Candidatus Thorarchaeota archaeon]